MTAANILGALGLAGLYVFLIIFIVGLCFDDWRQP